MATDEERDRVEKTPSVDSTADPADGSTADGATADEATAGEEIVEADASPAGDDDDEVEIDDPDALERATQRVSDSELSEDDELVDEPTDAELAALTEGLDSRAKADDQAEADGNESDDRELVGVGAPTKRSAAKAKSAQPAQKKGRATPKRDGGAPEHKRTGPVTFVKESVGELRKVVYPTGPQLLNYFVVVLIFVLFVIAFVSVLDLAFGWAILKIFS